MIPHKQSLVQQVASILRKGIREGLWADWLPGERALCETLRVSRSTLRTAINLLQVEGVLVAVHGRGTQIIGKPQQVESPACRGALIGLITSTSIEQVRPTTAIWLDELRELLFEAGFLFKICHGSQYARRNPSSDLAFLHSSHQAICWILQQSTKSMQKWFETSRIPCVVAGTSYEGIAVPSVDLDYRALCRHAVGTMVSRGHRRISMLTPATNKAGDLEGEVGFQEGLNLSPHYDLKAAVFRHGDALEQISRAIDRILKIEEPPTAILVSKSYVYLTLISRAAQMGLRVPHDISVVCRETDPFLQYVTPRPAHYTVDPRMYARRLLRTVIGVIDGAISGDKKTLILPQFKSGESLANRRKATAA